MRATAILAECNRCQRPIIQALCEAMETTCEAVPLSRFGELQAAISGRKTYRLDFDKRLWRNDRYRIRTDVPLPGDHRLTTHVCYAPFPPEWAAPVAQPQTRTASTDTDERLF